jgi:hypothetical protein
MGEPGPHCSHPLSAGRRTQGPLPRQSGAQRTKTSSPPVHVGSCGEGQVPLSVTMCRMKGLTYATVRESQIEAMPTLPEICHP